MLKIRKMMKRQQGFTLIELIVVIAILGVLAALIVPRFANTASGAKEAAVDANKKIIESALELYYAENGAYPGSIEALVPKYLKEIPDGVTIGEYNAGDGENAPTFKVSVD